MNVLFADPANDYSIQQFRHESRIGTLFPYAEVSSSRLENSCRSFPFYGRKWKPSGKV